MSKLIQLGSRVRCQASRFEGVAMARVEIFGGNIQYAVQPESQGNGVFPDAFNMDHHTLVVLDKGISDQAITPAKCEFELGHKVRDRATGLVGVVTSRTTFLNGCIYLNVVPPVVEGEKPRDAVFLSDKRFELVDRGIASPVARGTTRSPGGPSTRALRAA